MTTETTTPVASRLTPEEVEVLKKAYEKFGRGRQAISVAADYSGQPKSTVRYYFKKFWLEEYI
jgi:hypothetical protein